MNLSQNKKYQYIFFTLISNYIIFNGGNSNLQLQINFVFIGLLFLFCLKNKNYITHLNFFYQTNRKFICFYLFFLIYIFFQFLPLPLEILKFFSPSKYQYLDSLLINIDYSPISLSGTNSYFQFLNYISILLIILIVKMIFYKKKHINRLYFFLSISGSLASVFAIILYLNGNPDIIFLKKTFYKNTSTGFFVNRTVFSVFLIICLIASLELLKIYDEEKLYKKKDNFFLQIYVRLFIMIISIGIITSFSRIGNCLLLITILILIFKNIVYRESSNYRFIILLVFILLIDVLFLGYYFGSSRILERFYLLSEEFSYIDQDFENLKRLSIIKFGISQFKNFYLFGYGLGGFENLFKIEYLNNTSYYADHVHSDIVEILGSIGLFGFTILFLSIFKFVFTKINYFKFVLFINLSVILIFDFSFQIPLIQILFIILFSISNFESTRINSNKYIN